MKQEKERKRKQDAQGMPNTLCPIRAEAGHTHQSSNGSWDCKRASASFLHLAWRAWVGVRGWEAPDKASGAEETLLSLFVKVNNTPERSPVGTVPTSKLSSEEGTVENAPSGQIEEKGLTWVG